MIRPPQSDDDDSDDSDETDSDETDSGEDEEEEEEEEDDDEDDDDGYIDHRRFTVAREDDISGWKSLLRYLPSITKAIDQVCVCIVIIYDMI